MEGFIYGKIMTARTNRSWFETSLNVAINFSLKQHLVVRTSRRFYLRSGTLQVAGIRGYAGGVSQPRRGTRAFFKKGEE